MTLHLKSYELPISASPPPPAFFPACCRLLPSHSLSVRRLNAMFLWPLLHLFISGALDCSSEINTHLLYHIIVPRCQFTD